MSPHLRANYMKNCTGNLFSIMQFFLWFTVVESCMFLFFDALLMLITVANYAICLLSVYALLMLITHESGKEDFALSNLLLRLGW